MKNAAYIILALLTVTPLNARADNHAALNEKGNRAYTGGDYKKALEFYRQAEIERPETPEIDYNYANALVQSGSYEEAAKKYEKALAANDVRFQSEIYYNSGNNLFLQEDYTKAVEAYQQALELNPDDLDAKYNLELARNRLREQMKRQSQGQNEQQQQQQSQEQKQEQKNQKQENQDQSQDQQQQEQKQQPQPQPKPDEMTREDALRILRAVEEADRENLENQERFKAQGIYLGKDW